MKRNQNQIKVCSICGRGKFYAHKKITKTSSAIVK